MLRSKMSRSTMSAGVSMSAASSPTRAGACWVMRAVLFAQRRERQLAGAVERLVRTRVTHEREDREAFSSYFGVFPSQTQRRPGLSVAPLSWHEPQAMPLVLPVMTKSPYLRPVYAGTATSTFDLNQKFPSTS